VAGDEEEDVDVVDEAEVDAPGSPWRLRIRDDVQVVEEEERNPFHGSGELIGDHGVGTG
jgi:hypothetical protein